MSEAASLVSLGAGVEAVARALDGPAPGAWALALAAALVWLGPVLLIVLPIAALGQIIERKVAAAMQRRYGPNTAGLDGLLRFLVRVGAFFLPRATQERLIARLCRLPGMGLARRLGLGQLVADGIKMLGKEDLIPANADGWVFRIAPYLAMCGALLPFAAIPFGQHLAALEVSVAALYVAAAGGLTVIALFMAGWGSGNKFSLLGGMRAVAQVVSYEIPVGLAIAGVVLWCGTMDLQRIVASQYNGHWLSMLGWNLFQSPFLAVLAGVLLVAGLAECQRTPFDMAEAESELVSGFNTEYSGLRWGMFAMAEYAEMFLVGAVFATLFLGGYQAPVLEPWVIALPAWLAAIVHALMLAIKATLILFVMVWLRWTLPRLRVDQVMRLCWLTLVPLALVALFGLALTMLAAVQVAPGTAYGRLPAQLEPHLTPAAHAAAWLLPVALAALIVWLARRRYGAVHPDLARLSGGPS